ncbi:MAG: PilX N-terminal domain-containing pilus assembly protein [Nitrospira sp.]|nr:PilX N-terminal domain-containing pilus assembly protein [Nitrospira sp.]MDE0404840.1 PilX N-terminal domain-containing pilus assembly protein [Nitrospira sp.]MDE0486678.1 PilX N-terminal domain-containing pilus assembly protein [Nitrospira sp.]
MIESSDGNVAGGFALVAVLLLLAVAGLVTATVLQTTSTEIRISGNHKQAVQELYAAEAGLAEARSRLRKTLGAEAAFIREAAVPPGPSWTAYVLESAEWTPSVDPEYASHETNLIPVPGNPTNTVVRPNSLQTGLPYWVKIRHKTEYDAERAGHRPSTPHYVDLDGSTSRHTKSNRGNVVYFGYPSTTSRDPVSFTTNFPTPWLPIEKIIAHGSATSGTVVLEEEVVHPPGPNQLGAVHASGDVSLSGGPVTINGHDACGAVGSLPPVVYGGTVTSAPAIQFNGNPANPRHSSFVPDPARVLVTLNTDAAELNADQIHQQLGTASVPMTFYAKGGSFAQPQGIRIRQTRGFGILLVNGNATLEGEVYWDGMILVTGALFLNGQGSGIVIRGGIWASRVEQTGPVSLQYDSCRLQAAMLSVPTRIRTWREVF